MWSGFQFALRYGKTGNKKHATWLVALFATHIKPAVQQIRLLIG